MNTKVSKEIQEQAIKVAKGTQKKGQTKEQTKLIAQGIEKGIAEYKKQQSKKSRESDKLRKQKAKKKVGIETNEVVEAATTEASTNNVPWVLLVVSWIGFLTYLANLPKL